MHSDKHSTDGVTKLEFAFTYYRHLKKLRAYVEHRRHEPIRLADAAASIGVSTSRLSHLFHEKTGMRFSDWFCRKRIADAEKLLRSSDASICDIAYSVGFRNTRTFERAFRKINGMSASKYRKVMMTQTVSHK